MSGPLRTYAFCAKLSSFNMWDNGQKCPKFKVFCYICSMIRLCIEYHSFGNTCKLNSTPFFGVGFHANCSGSRSQCSDSGSPLRRGVLNWPGCTYAKKGVSPDSTNKNKGRVGVKKPEIFVYVLYGWPLMSQSKLIL